MKFKVPILKGNDFPILLFNIISENIQNLAYEHRKWPNKITFLGQLGKEIFDIIDEKKWDFGKFNITHKLHTVDMIIIEYNKPLDQIDDMGYIKGDSIHGKTMEGIPGTDTISKLRGHSLNMNFKIERKIRPKLEIELIR